jgi:hypothetical protein
VIHHVSIPARDPQHVAQVLAELFGGYAGPFIGPMPGAWVVYQEDSHGSGIEVYSERTTHFWRGPPGTRLFELYEFWVENRIMLELVTEDMLAPYVKIANGAAQRALFDGYNRSK